jgi:lipid II:glycine glycyltransferase (peptidoglycan interpeptide bridge formation enzyme)
VQLQKVLDVQPAITRIVDLRKTEEALYGEMKSKTRYNARLSERQGVECKIVGLEEFPNFVRLMKQTAKRDKFSIHPEEYFKKMLETLTGGETHALMAMAYFEGRPLAANICVDFGGARTYLHGATSNLHRNIRAQYGLHTFLLRDAQERGLKSFDFWGVAPEGFADDHEWAGISRYKEGYGGSIVEMPGTFDCVLKTAWYKTYQAGRKLRRL